MEIESQTEKDFDQLLYDIIISMNLKGRPTGMKIEKT